MLPTISSKNILLLKDSESIVNKLDKDVDLIANNVFYFIKNLDEAHALHIRHYGSDNSDRLTGLHETSSMYKFSYSVGGRNTSIRIPYSTKEAKRGYFEDRRPSSSLDPYKSTALLHATSVGLEQSFWE